jgi:hypothetical protein
MDCTAPAAVRGTGIIGVASPGSLTRTATRMPAQITRSGVARTKAYLGQVTAADMFPLVVGSKVSTTPGVPITCPAVVMVNSGRYAITDIDARYNSDGKGISSYGDPSTKHGERV